MNRDLYTPSISDHAVAAAADQQTPWRPASLYWVAIFCGPFVVTMLAFLNSRRLGLPKGQQRFILLVGLLVTAFCLAFILWSMSTFGIARDDVRARLLPRWTWQFVTLMWAAIIVRLQTPAARRYEQRTDGGYASMWRAGLYWSLVSIVVFGVPIVGLAWHWGLFNPGPR